MLPPNFPALLVPKVNPAGMKTYAIKRNTLNTTTSSCRATFNNYARGHGATHGDSAIAVCYEWSVDKRRLAYAAVKSNIFRRCRDS